MCPHALVSQAETGSTLKRFFQSSDKEGPNLLKACRTDKPIASTSKKAISFINFNCTTREWIVIDWRKNNEEQEKPCAIRNNYIQQHTAKSLKGKYGWLFTTTHNPKVANSGPALQEEFRLIEPLVLGARGCGFVEILRVFAEFCTHNLFILFIIIALA